MSTRLTTIRKPSSVGVVVPSTASVILQRKCACGGSSGPSGECEECRKNRLQRKATKDAAPAEVPGIVHDVLRSPGQPLDAATRAFFEPRFGHDFSHVRVHTDARAAESARTVNALAYTVGRDLVFDAGQYAPHVGWGQHLLAHELSHTVQQRALGRSSSIVFGDASMEAPANDAADAVMRGSQPLVAGRSGPALSRQEASRSNVDASRSDGDPQTLRKTADLKQQSDEWLVKEIELIRDWMARRTSSSLDEQRLLGVLSEAGTLLLNRHPEILEGLQESLSQLPPGTPISLSLAPFITKVGVQQAEKITAEAFAKAGMRVAGSAAGTTGTATGTGSAAAAGGGAAAGGISLLGVGLWGFLIFIFFAPRGDYISPELLTRMTQAVIYAATKTKTAPKPKPAPKPIPKVTNATCVSKAQKLSAGGCNFIPVDPKAMGGLGAINEQQNPQAAEYCREFTGNEPCEYWLYPRGGGPGLVQEWARFDGFDGHSLIECKCGYDWYVEAAAGRKGLPYEQRRAQGVLDGMIREVLNHLRRAAECGVPYKMVVSSRSLKEYLVSQGVPENIIEVRPSEICD